VPFASQLACNSERFVVSFLPECQACRARAMRCRALRDQDSNGGRSVAHMRRPPQRDLLNRREPIAAGPDDFMLMVESGQGI
jgi:anti-sigma factor RsiW